MASQPFREDVPLKSQRFKGTATIISRGRKTIPACVRNELKLGPGDQVEFIRVPEDHWEVITADQDVTRLRGMIKATRRVNVEEMDLAIRQRV